jgi:ABC-type Fe3+/spermidine/putrescine transport system ATPase subunit
MASVRIEGLVKRFGKTVAVDAVSLRVADGQLVTLLGPSGCGKTTILRCIAGLAEPEAGEIYFGDRLVNDVPTSHRRIGLLFQRLALFPHMRVYDNVAFGLRMQKRPRAEVEERVRKALELVRLPGFEQRYPRQLSGGQQQRVALARTIVTDPEILLFDEPLSSLDAKLRDELKTEIRRLHLETGKTTIYVTHDQAEAFAISDKVYVMHEGRVEQEGTPLDLYVKPASPFVAAFIGANNFVPGAAVGRDPARPGGLLVEALGCRAWAEGGEDLRAGTPLVLLIRPEDIEVLRGEEPGPGLGVAGGRVTGSTFAGAHTALEVEAAGHPVKVSVYGPERFDLVASAGQEVRFALRRCTVIRADAAGEPGVFTKST